MKQFLLVLAIVALAASPSFAKGTRARSTPRTTTHASAPHTAAPVARDAKGHIKRSHHAVHEFEQDSGWPHGRPGYVVDHIKPLACGGLDVPSNMQWQTIADAKVKDATERHGCH